MLILDDNDHRGLAIIGRIVARVLDTLCREAAPGMTTGDLDNLAGELLFKYDADATPRKEYGFPGRLCISVNDEVVHGVPGGRVLCKGDLVKIDLTADRRGYVADAARMIIPGGGNDLAQRLAESSRRACLAAIAAVRPGMRIGELGRVIEQSAKDDGFAIFKELSGHGVGRHTHEEPMVPNYDDGNRNAVLRKGMVIAIEPIIGAGSCGLRKLADGWTMVTEDGSLTGHYEETVLVTGEGAEVLTICPRTL